jgi:hypothetical protein
LLPRPKVVDDRDVPLDDAVALQAVDPATHRRGREVDGAGQLADGDAGVVPQQVEQLPVDVVES